MRAPGRAAALCALAMAAAACDGGQGYTRVEPAASLWGSPAGGAPERRFAAEGWDTLWTVGGAGDDSLLLNPFWVQTARGRVVVFDAGAQRAVAFDAADGRERWRFGREGAGPDEFRGVRDVKSSADSLLVFLDPRNNRILTLSPDGEPRARIPLTRAGHAEQVVPLASGGFVLATLNPDTPLVAIDARGERAASPAIPWKGYARLHPLARQGSTAVSDDGRRWVYGFMLGDGWFAYDGLRPAGEPRRYAEHRPFPVIEVRSAGGTESAALAQYSPCTGCALVLADTSLYVLSGGSDRSGRAVVDRFHAGDGRYLHSYRLPVRGRQLAVRGDTFYLVVDEPYPALLALRPRHGPATAVAAR